MDYKAKKELETHLVGRDQSRNASGVVGIIQSYNSSTNMATVLISDSASDLPGDIVTDVICPAFMGLQLVAPEPGRPCWVVFKEGQNDRKVMITHYFNHNYKKFDSYRQSYSRASVPRYMVGW